MRLIIAACLFAISFAQTETEEVGSFDIPVYHTPEINGILGWRKMPEGLLDACTEPICDECGDFRGLWIEQNQGWVLSMEQCGDRIIMVGNGVIHDMHGDSTEENGLTDYDKDCICETEEQIEDEVERRTCEIAGPSTWLEQHLRTGNRGLIMKDWEAYYEWSLIDDGRLTRQVPSEELLESDAKYAQLDTEPWYFERIESFDGLGYDCDLWGEETSNIETSSASISPTWILIILSVPMVCVVSYLAYKSRKLKMVHVNLKEELEI